MMITKETYTIAYDVVMQYHRQVTVANGGNGGCVENPDATLREFAQDVELSDRLKAAVKVLLSRHGDILLVGIGVSHLSCIYQVGQLTIAEFMDKRGRYLQSPRPPCEPREEQQLNPDTTVN